jgi:anti-anti-sigma factor
VVNASNQVSPFVGDSEMAERMRGFDWAATPIGPVEGWPQSLRTAVGICLSSRHPMVIWWGPELVLLYNDAWVPILGPSKHPALGRPGASVWPEMWHIIGEQLSSVLATGLATWSDDQLLPADRFGYLEEAYFTYSYSAIHDESGAVGGVFTAVTETTSRVLGERRLSTLRELGEVSAVTAPSVELACASALNVLSGNRADLPFALIYLLATDGRSGQLMGSYGVVPDAAGGTTPPMVPHPDDEDLVRQVVSTGRSAVATGLSQRYPGALLPGVTEVGDGQPDTAVVLPLASAALDRPVGVLVAGISPFRALDEDYLAFCQLVARHVAAAVADARAYEAERRRAESLAELDRAKTEFFANISHEFRTPLTLMMGPLAELRAAPALDADARLRKELEVIHRNGLRLGKLVNTLLDFSRIQSGRVQACYEPVDLGAFTAELASVFRSAIQRAGLRLDVDCSELGEPVYVDREMWEKVVLNLLSNAVKFTFDGGITVAVRRSDGTAVVTVADTGTGVPAEELPRLFERFHRVRGARARSNEGSGIGLALVAELVALHGGAITADSTPGVGTTLTVTLPLGSAHLPADQLGSAAVAPGTTEWATPFVTEALRWLPDAAAAREESAQGDDVQEESTQGSSIPLGPVAGDPLGSAQGRVLIADDNADMREYLQRLLRTRYNVQVVRDGLAALHAATARPPELIVSDVMMPGMDGLELLAALRADPRTARVPVLLLSARAGQEAAIEGLAAGADDYLVKPFSAGELLARVGAHLHLGRVRREAEERFRVMADLAPALIWVADRAGERMFLNRGWRDFTGSEASAQVGLGWQDGVHPEDLPGYQAVFTRALAAREPWQFEYRLRRADGAYHWVLEHAAPIGAGDSFAGYVGSAVDINTRYRETQRQTLLAELAAALGTETGVAQRMARLTQLLVDRGLADQCTAIRVDPAGALRWVAGAADNDTAVESLAKLAADSPLIRQVRDTGQSLLIGDIPAGPHEQDDPDSEQLALRCRLAWKSAMAVPLIARGRLLGILTAGRTAGTAGHPATAVRPAFTIDDLALLEEIAGRASISLDNALLLAEERGTAARLELLQHATSALSRAATPVQVANTAITQFGRLLDTPAVAMWELRETDILEALDLGGWPQDAQQDWVSLPIDAPAPAGDAARLLEPIWVERRADWERDYPRLLATVQDYGYETVGCLPLLAGGRCLGVIGLGFAEERVLTATERATALALADQCAQALQRAELLVAERNARRGAEEFGDVVAALSGATTPIGVAEVILGHAAELGARSAVVVLRGGDYTEHLKVLAASGPAAPEVHAGEWQLPIDAAHPLSHAVRTGEPVWVGSRSRVAWQDRRFTSEETVLPAQVVVPLVLGGSALGAIGMHFGEELPVLTADQRSRLVTLAGQYAQALERARLHQAEHNVAHTLQRSLLPRQLPELDRLALAARYLPGAQDVAAGGDWYDVMALADRRVAVVVGDVVGKGAAAAATMGQLRIALATALLHGESPAAALEHLDRVATRIPGSLACTAAVMILELDSGQLSWSRAGHPPPLLLTEGDARYLTGGAGVPLGIRIRAPYTDAATRIEPGATLLLYTDGLFERRGQVLDEGLDHLAATAAQLHGDPPDTLVAQLLASALPDSGPADDIALIAARYLPAPLQQRLPAEPAVLPGVRRAVRAWTRTAALPAELTEDLQLALGEAVANAVEHAYTTAGKPRSNTGEFTYYIARQANGAIDVEVRDFGHWRPEPPDNSHRGRGLDMIRGISTGVVIKSSSTGTQVGFHLPAPPPELRPPLRVPLPPDRRPTADSATPPVLAELRMHAEPDGSRRLEIRGELDLAAATTLRGQLLAQLQPPGPVILDLQAVDYLSSAGVGLLIDTAQHAATHHTPLRLKLTPGSLPDRVLTLAGLDPTLGCAAEAGEEPLRRTL